MGSENRLSLHTDQVRKVLGPIVGQAVRDRDEPPSLVTRIPTLTGVVISNRFVRFVDINTAFGCLDSQTQAIIEKRYADDRTVAQCAQMFKMSEPTVRKRIKDALNDLIDAVLVNDEEYHEFEEALANKNRRGKDRI